MSTSNSRESETVANDKRTTERLHSVSKSCDFNITQYPKCPSNCKDSVGNDYYSEHATSQDNGNGNIRNPNNIFCLGNNDSVALTLPRENGAETLLEKSRHCERDCAGSGLLSVKGESNFKKQEVLLRDSEESLLLDRTFLKKQTISLEQSGDIADTNLKHSVCEETFSDYSVDPQSDNFTENLSHSCMVEGISHTSGENVSGCDKVDENMTASPMNEEQSLISDQTQDVNTKLYTDLIKSAETVTQNAGGMRIKIPSSDTNASQEETSNASCASFDSENDKHVVDNVIPNTIKDDPLKNESELHYFPLKHDTNHVLGSPGNGSCPDSPNSCEPGTSSSSVASAADSGVSSEIQDEDIDPDLYFNQNVKFNAVTLDAELFEKLQSDFEIVDNWTPSTRNTYEPSLETKVVIDEEDSGETGDDTKASQSRLKTLFARSNVQRKSSGSSQVGVGWKLFGKVSKEAKRTKSESEAESIKNEKHEEHIEEIEATSQIEPTASKSESSESSDNSMQQKKSTFLKTKNSKKNSSTVPSSTTALILENRPSHLPPKNPKEEKRHREMYEAMIEEAKKKELRDLQQQKKKQRDMAKQEQTISSTLSVWTNEILPNWETKSYSRKVRDMWWQGLPPSVRGKVWKLAIGNDLHITYELFEIFQSHACEKLMLANHRKEVLKINGNSAISTEIIPAPPVKEHAVELITLDVSRTFPSLGIFQKGGPYHNSLHTLLGAYTCYRPDVGYVQGMSFLAAVLLLNLEPADAFICFANLLNKPCQMAFFRVDQPVMNAYFAMFDVLVQENLPKLHAHFKKNNLSPDLYLFDWIFTLYSKSLPLDVACRVWDVFCRDGDELLFRTALGILSMHEEVLLKLDFIHLAKFLTKLPDDLSGELLFQSMASFTLSSTKYKQLLSKQKEKMLQGDFDDSVQVQGNVKTI